MMKYLISLSLVATLACAGCALGHPDDSGGDPGNAGGWCGDDICDPGSEDCLSCAWDCGGCGPTCGDGTCTAGEEGSCSADCGSFCGDGSCDAGEDSSCPTDCSLVTCGDGVCDLSESCLSCDADCGGCTTSCGNSTCEWSGGETCTNCGGDCGCGTTTCIEFVECAGPCPDSACQLTCWENTCPRGQDQYLLIIDCQSSFCASECDPLTGDQITCSDCTNATCVTAIDACVTGGC